MNDQGWVRPTPWPSLLTRRRLWAYLPLAVVMIAMVAVTASLLASLYDVPVALSLLIAVASAALLRLALQRPTAAAAGIIACTIATTILSSPWAVERTWPIPVITLINYCLVIMVLALRWPWQFAAGAILIGIVATTATSVSISTFSFAPLHPSDLITPTAILLLVLVLGSLVRQWLLSREQVQLQEQRAEHEAGLRRAMEERSRIARELHDVVAHGLSIISIQASTVRYRVEGVPEPVVVELEQISESAREALAEMRSLLQVLRAEDTETELAPQPSVARLPELIAASRRGGQEVNLEISGDLDTDLSEVTSLGAYRIVQEALSNALRHAPGQPIEVRVTVGERAVRVEISNPLAGADRGRTEPRRDGLGLLGMAERAKMAGGWVEAGRIGDDFRVVAELPRHGRATRS
ncbi:sensor histidine kinase [Naumannella halotolerans]|uniref:sensor histidine kinase n=1 Tax=Naumannella halotolerans TaxID=993414 RepID=UPI00370D56FA